MPNNRRRYFQRPTQFPYKAIVRESGGVAVIRADIANIVVKNVDGTEDRPVEEHDLGYMTEVKAEPIIKGIKTFNLKKHSKRVTKKYDWKKYPLTGRQ